MIRKYCSRAVTNQVSMRADATDRSIITLDVWLIYSLGLTAFIKPSNPPPCFHADKYDSLLLYYAPSNFLDFSISFANNDMSSIKATLSLLYKMDVVVIALMSTNN